MKTIVWEPRTKEIWGEYKNLEEAKKVWNIDKQSDCFEEKDGELWIALND